MKISHIKNKKIIYLSKYKKYLLGKKTTIRTTETIRKKLFSINHEYRELFPTTDDILAFIIFMFEEDKNISQYFLAKNKERYKELEREYRLTCLSVDHYKDSRDSWKQKYQLLKKVTSKKRNKKENGNTQ